MDSNFHDVATSVAPLNQTRRSLFHIPPTMQQTTTFEQARLEEEAANEIILEEQDVDVLQGAEAENGGALNPREMVEFLLEELLLSVVGKKIGDDNASSDDFFSQDSQPQQHLAPCSQDFAFFKAIEQTREDLTTEEDESQDELSPPSQLVCSPSTSELGHLLGLNSQEEFFSSPEGAPALKRRRTLTTQEVEDIRIKMVGEDAEDEVMEGNRSTDDEEDALPLTFHTKEHLIRKLKGIHYIPRGKPSY